MTARSLNNLLAAVAESFLEIQFERARSFEEKCFHSSSTLRLSSGVLSRGFITRKEEVRECQALGSPMECF